MFWTACWTLTLRHLITQNFAESHTFACFCTECVQVLFKAEFELLSNRPTAPHQVQSKHHYSVFINLQKRSCRYELQWNNKSRSQPAVGNARRPSLAAAAAGRQLLDRGQAGLGSVWIRTNSQIHVRNHPEAKWRRSGAQEKTGGQKQTKRTEAGIKTRKTKRKDDEKSSVKMGMMSFPVLLNVRKNRTA